MTTQSIPQQALSPAGRRWYHGYLSALDAKHLDAFGAFLAEDCEFGMNNDPPAVGRDAVLAALAGFFAAFDRLDHEALTTVGGDHAFAGEALNHFVRHDGGRVTVRTAGFITRNADGFATRAQVYGDYSALFAPA